MNKSGCQGQAHPQWVAEGLPKSHPLLPGAAVLHQNGRQDDPLRKWLVNRPLSHPGILSDVRISSEAVVRGGLRQSPLTHANDSDVI